MSGVGQKNGERGQGTIEEYEIKTEVTIITVTCVTYLTRKKSTGGLDTIHGWGKEEKKER